MRSHYSVPGLSGEITILRDAFGIPHIGAACPTDAWFGMGFACAEDRLFQMDYDRRRAVGRWSEVAGLGAIPADVLARRMRLQQAARADLEIMSEPLRLGFEAYARGVNLAMETGRCPLEAETLGYQLEPWEPWQSIAAFKVRHVLMGLWQHKLAQALILARSGRQAFARLETRPPFGSTLTVPPGGRLRHLLGHALEDIAAAEPHLGFLAEVEPGSNAWAISAKRTSHGAAVLCNDSHRALDIPNVYWQCQVTCDEFDVIGATFPGLPGFPHFAHNGKVAWAITHAGADTQDLYIEWFDEQRPGRYRIPDGWADATRRTEKIWVRNSAPLEIEIWETRHGPIVHGDPRHGMALALSYTATGQATTGFEPMLAMLGARDVTELVDSQRQWVDPVNNLVAADTAGRIAYQTRGALPVRSSGAHRYLPVPGWTGQCEWVSTVAFESLPRAVDPEAGYVMTTNNVIADGDDPYVSFSFADPFRAERLRSLLSEPATHRLEDLAAMQGDTISWSAQAWVRVLSASGPYPEGGPAEEARRVLSNWDGDLRSQSGAALLYGCFRRALAAKLYRPVVGSDTWEWIISDTLPAAGVLVRRWLANDTWEFLGGPTGPGKGDGDFGRAQTGAVEAAVAPALTQAWSDACAMAGPDPAAWRWSDHHRLIPRHPLSSLDQAWPSPLQADPVGMGGDPDTIQAGSYGWRPRTPFTVTGLSVYRQVVDLGDPDHASYVIPGGASGDPRHPHFADQLAYWADLRRIPMVYRPDELDSSSARVTVLTPAPASPIDP